VDSLTSKQRAHLRGLAHGLKPVVHVGKESVNEAVLAAIEEALHTRELLKVRVLDAAPVDTADAGRAVAEAMDDVQLVQVVGNVFVLYRPFSESPKIRLPA